MSRGKQIGIGFKYIGSGFRFFFGNRSLWIYSIIPTTINILVLVGLILGLTHYFDDLTTWIFGNGATEHTHSGFFAKTWGIIAATLIWIVKALIFIVVMLFILIICFIFSMILSGPFNDLISEKVEQIITGNEAPFNFKIFLKSIWRSIIVETQKIFFFVGIPILLLVINLIPLFGNLAYLVLANIFACFDIGFNFIDYPMSRRLWTFSKRLKFALNNKYYFMGFGSVILVPFFTYLFSSPMVTGGTLLFNELNVRNCGGGGQPSL